MTEEEKVFRAYFEITIDRQEKLRELLDTLIDEARPIKNDSERKKYLLLLSRATLGCGTNDNLNLSQYGYGKKSEIENFEKTSRWLAYQEKEKLNPPVWSSPPAAREEEVEIVNFWKLIRDTAFSVFPRAINLSVQASPERMEQTRKEADYV